MLSAFRTAFGAVVVLAAVAQAPFQCAGEVDPDRRIEEDPSEVLYTLAGRFKSGGDQRAYAGTLKFLIERYPSSRFSRMAREDLDALGAPKPQEKSE